MTLRENIGNEGRGDKDVVIGKKKGWGDSSGYTSKEYQHRLHKYVYALFASQTRRTISLFPFPPPLLDIPNERISEVEGAVNSASEGGRHTDISAFCPRSLESHFNARIDAWNAHLSLLPSSLPSLFPRLEPLGRSPPSFHQESSLLREGRYEGVDLSAREIFFAERKNSGRNDTTLISSIPRHRDTRKVRHGPLTLTRLGISPYLPTRSSLETSSIGDRKTLAGHELEGLARFTASLRRRYEGEVKDSESLNEVNTGRAINRADLWISRDP